MTTDLEAPANQSEQVPPSPPSVPKQKPRKGKPLGLTLAMVIAAGGLWLVTRPHHSGASGHSEESSLPVVAVEKVGREDLSQTVSLSAEFRPYQQVALHAKVAGYLQSISVDVGDHVKDGQVIAQLDVPELKEELQKATAAFGASEQEVARAEAAYTDAHLAFQRLQQVAKEHPKLVAQQDVDTATAKDSASASGVGAARQKVEEAKAEVSRMKALITYMTITAPFDGVVTRRLVDPGALIQAGTASNSQAVPLVEIVEDKRLRLAFPVPESAVSLVKVGSPVHVSVSALGETFSAKVSRFSDKVDHSTRTMWTEADVENPDNRFKPGMIADVTLTTRESKDAVAVPVQAIIAGETPKVLVVDSSGQVVESPIELGLETPSKAEVLKGLSSGQVVIVGNRTGIQPGQKVSPREVASVAAN